MTDVINYMVFCDGRGYVRSVWPRHHPPKTSRERIEFATYCLKTQREIVISEKRLGGAIGDRMTYVSMLYERGRSERWRREGKR